MAHPNIEAWIGSAVGRAINPDNAYGLQCVDVADDYAERIFGLPWQQTLGGVGGAREFAGRTNDFFTWHENVVGDPNSKPERGDLVVYNGDHLNPFGHVAVVLSSTPDTITVIQQDGFLQTAAHVATLPYVITGAGAATGWLRPNLAAPAPEPTQRRVGPAGVTERSSAEVRDDNKTGRIFAAGDVLNFKGFVHGGMANGTDLWFVGAFSGTYFSASAFEGDGVGSLPDLTPAPPTVAPTLEPHQRFAGAAGANKRAAPNAGAELLGTFAPGDKLNFKGWTRGAKPYGPDSSDVWLVGISDAFIHSSAVERGDDLTGLPEIVTGTPETPAPAPVAPYSFAKRWQCVTDIIPAHPANFMRGKMPERPVYLVIHQIDDPSRAPANGDWLGSATRWFQTERRNPSSAHLVAQGKRLAASVDTVDRAYHAGAVGNNDLAVEVPPNPDAETIETVKRFQREYRDTMGYSLKLRRHREVPGNNTSCGTNIDLALFDISGDTPAAPAPAPSMPVIEPGELEDFVAFLIGLYRASK